MPKTTVNKDRDALLLEYEIRPAQELGSMTERPTADSSLCEQSTKALLSTSITGAAISAHYP
jgi:hypothetical protein